MAFNVESKGCMDVKGRTDSTSEEEVLGESESDVSFTEIDHVFVDNGTTSSSSSF
jgi:hypothetical protein